MRYLRGRGGAAGLAIGQAFQYHPGDQVAGDPEPDMGLERFEAACRDVVGQMRALAAQLYTEGSSAEADLFEAHALLAEDPVLHDEVARRVHELGEAVAPAIRATVVQMRAALDVLDDPYLRERAADIEMLGQAILRSLYGGSPGMRDLPAGVIVVAPELSPAEIVGVRGIAAGFATAGGGPTSHTIILARAFGIPAVVGLGEAVLALPEGVNLALDGLAALLVVEPDPAERLNYARRMGAAPDVLINGPGRLKYGPAVTLLANIGHPEEVRAAREYGAEGVGLFRSEFLFLERATPPDEDEQYAAYRSVLEALPGRPVTVRTLDVGGDKQLPYLDLPHEPNPALGLRGLRMCMRYPELLATQLRALLRAAVHGDLRIMLPMVATIEDLRWGQAQLAAAAAMLAERQAAFRADLPLGVMIETPAAAVIADLLAREAAFFSIGSNDLGQYTLAIDREAAEWAGHYSGHDLAVLRLIQMAARAASRAKIPICLCGELASQPEIVPLLVGLGVFELSMAPAAIPLVKQRLSELTLARARAAAKKALSLHSML